MDDLLEIFRNIEPSPEKRDGSRVFLTKAIPNSATHRISKTFEGRPCVLLATNDDSNSVVPALRLRHLHAEYNVLATLDNGHAHTTSQTFAAITLLLDDDLMVGAFLRFAALLSNTVGEKPNSSEVFQAVSQFASLLRALIRGPRKSTQGLWAEIFVIQACDRPDQWIDAWHNDPQEVYDFCFPSVRVEVKSASSRVRRHRFSLQQLRPPAAGRVLVASLFVEPSRGGLSIADLAAQLRGRISLEQAVKLDRIIAETLGENIAEALQTKFAMDMAQESLLFFPASNIPSIAEVPYGVEEVTFISRLQEDHGQKSFPIACEGL
jgi:hypothetical protein